MMGDRPLRLFSGKWMRTAVASVTVAGVFVLPAAALGNPHPGDADFGYAYNAETQQIGFWFGPADAEVVCAWTDDSTDESILEATDASGTQCFVVDIAGPNGQINHGSIVAAFVSGLSDVLEVSGYDGPSGQFISEIAKSGTGKTTDEDHDPSAVAEEVKESRGSKNKGTGVSIDTHIPDVVDVSSDDGDDESESSDDADNSGGDSNGQSDGKSNAGGNGNSGGRGSDNANENANGKGIGKQG